MSGLSNSERKHLRSLQRKKERREKNQILVEGIRLCEEALTSDWRLKQIYITQSFLDHPESDHLLGLAGEKHLVPTEITESEMEQITPTKQSQGVALLVDLPEERSPEFDPDWHPHILLLDGVSDPGNLGTLLRSADWFGVRHSLLGPGCVEWANPKVVRASMGAVFRMHLSDLNSWPPVLTRLRETGYTLITADMEGAPLHKYSATGIPDAWGLILGNEAHGISDQLQAEADVRLTLPGDGPADSLNVAMAGTVFLYDLTARR